MESFHDDEEASIHGGQRRRDETVRRAQLYDVSSTRRLPQVQLESPDARTRKELQLLTEPSPLIAAHGLSIYEEELEQRKHQEHRSFRPALDQSQPLKDLYSTVPRRVHLNEEETSESTAKHTREWRMGYKNEPRSTYHGAALRGTFEPSDTTRERLVQTTNEYRQSSILLAYPTPYTTEATVAQQLEPFDAERARKDLEAKLRVNVAPSPLKKKHWSPASVATLGVKAPPRKSKVARKAMQMDQRIPIRKADSPLKKTELQADARHIRKQQALIKQVNEAYTAIQQQAAQAKDPTERYSLPIENPTFERAYRLGLDPVDSSPLESVGSLSSPCLHTKKSDKPPKSQLLFRPKSAVCLRMDTTLSPQLTRSSSSMSLSQSCGKVAGAKRRPHSATVSYLSNSTVYVMNRSSTTSVHPNEGSSSAQDPPSTTTSKDSITAALISNAHEVLQEQKKYGANFLGVVLEERVRRRELQQERLFDLARRGLLHSIPIPQIFARLRREALKNLVKRNEYARYEKLSLEDYMSICGMAIVPETLPPRHDTLEGMQPIQDDGDDDEVIDDQIDNTKAHELHNPVIQALEDEVELRQLPYDEPISSVFRKRQAIRPNPSGNNSSTVEAMRKTLFVAREQFHIAMEAFALATRDVNLLYSSLDLNVDDNVQLWEIICVIEQLQDGHEEIHRSRVHVKARNLPKELSGLRRSVSFPHRTHVPLPLTTL